MARIAGVNIPTGKRVLIALQYIHGIGPAVANEICEAVKIDLSRRVTDLSDAEVLAIREYIDANLTVEGDLRREVSMNVKRLMDLGCYPVHWARDLCGEPTVTAATAVVDDDDPLIDAELTMELAFESGATGRVHSSMTAPQRDISLRVIGDRGEIRAVNPMAPQTGNLLTVITAGGTSSGSVEAGVSYDHMVRAFVDHVRHGAPFPTRGADSVANMTVIDAAYLAAGLPARGTGGIDHERPAG